MNEVIKVLKQVQSLRLIAGQRLSIQSPKLDGMPRSPTKINSVENRMVKQIDAKRKLDYIEFALSLLSNDDQHLLAETYFNSESPTNYGVAMKLGISERTYYRQRKQALLHFREAYFGY
ncbi:DUF1492 domain-containing protein [Pediococcus ethanolidurans]|uniref:ArpU family phage packaging/lysis transcriptional regulator n=1 Tax=Pediococcus ethanolidurans TaxID=319653 RepID=UPI0021E8758A|nr:ArpU family phage packaging/lysis transcriptional regulator [Pediococcus ethanolidurans]MCV3321541.1 DUF1492 domain-containing protein [Pediococcus ethanolidurans]